MLHLSWRGHQTCTAMSTQQGTARLRARTKRALWWGDYSAWDLEFFLIIFFFPPQSSEQSASAKDWFRKASKSLHVPTVALFPHFLTLPVCPKSSFTAQKTKLAKIAAWQAGTYSHGPLLSVTKFLPAPPRVLATSLESVESTHTFYHLAHVFSEKTQPLSPTLFQLLSNPTCSKAIHS